MICTLPTDLLEKTGSVTNVRTGEQASIIPIISMVEAPTKENDTFHALNRIASFISVIAGIFCLLQFFYLIRNINRGDIFSWKNVKFLRKLGWALILLFICTLATIVIGNYELRKCCNSTDASSPIPLLFPMRLSFWDSFHCW